MKNKPDPAQCKARQLMVNDYVDNRMSEQEKDDFMMWIQNCQKEYQCNICLDRLHSFSHMKILCRELSLHTEVPSEMVNKIKAQLY